MRTGWEISYCPDICFRQEQLYSDKQYSLSIMFWVHSHFFFCTGVSCSWHLKIQKLMSRKFLLLKICPNFLAALAQVAFPLLWLRIVEFYLKFLSHEYNGMVGSKQEPNSTVTSKIPNLCERTRLYFSKDHWWLLFGIQMEKWTKKIKEIIIDKLLGFHLIRLIGLDRYILST